jgi:hypothetical protein
MPNFTTTSIPEILIEVCRRLSTHIASHDSNVTTEPVPGNRHFPRDSLSPRFDADVPSYDARLANGDVVDNCCGV